MISIWAEIEYIYRMFEIILLKFTIKFINKQTNKLDQITKI